MESSPVHLAGASVFLDFDGTISTADIGVHLLERARRAAEWRELARRSTSAGEIGSRECLVDEWALVEGDEADLRAVAAEVPLDPAFGPLVDGLRAAGAEVTVVSDGFGFYVDEACAPLGVSTCSPTRSTSRPGELLFPHEDRCCPCSTCGVCKQAPIKDAQLPRADRRCSSATAPATARPRCSPTSCSPRARSRAGARRTASRYTPFDTLDDVRAALLGPKVACAIALGSDERTPLTDAVARRSARRAATTSCVVGPPAGEATQWAEVGRAVGELVAGGACRHGRAVLLDRAPARRSRPTRCAGVRAALCTDAATAAGARQWNDANVLVMGLRLTSPEVAREMLDAWFATDADPASERRRLEHRPCSTRSP